MALKDRVTSLHHYLTGRETSSRIFRLVIEATNSCNLTCIMCPRNTMTRKIDHMGEEMFEKIIAESHDSLEFVSLNGYGEPLLHPALFKYLEICRKYHVPTGISTNCTKLHSEMVEKLLAEGPDQLILAIDSVEKKSYEQVRVGAVFENVLENVKDFLKRREERGNRSFVVLQCIYMRETKHQIRHFRNYFSAYTYDALRIRQLTYSGRNRQDADYKNRFNACYWLWMEPMILSNGTVVPCCQDVNGKLALGNIREKSLAEMWQEGYIRELRRRHAKGERASIPICKTCNMYQPGVVLAIGASVFDTALLNRWLPTIETTISSLRYNRNKAKSK